MFSYWLNSRARRTSALLGAATVSVMTHGLVISTWVVATLPRGGGVGLGPDSLSNRPEYLPPPDKSPAGQGTTAVSDHVSYFAIARPSPRGVGDALPKPKPPLEKPKEVAIADSTPVLIEPPQPAPKQDSVFTELEVDTPVRVTASAAPDYPADLLKQNIEGHVTARWVIDTTGRADTTSFELLQATRPEFAAAVRAALPHMRFAPARIGTTPVRQLVEQSIAFKIQTPAPVVAPKPGAPATKPVPPAGLRLTGR